MSKMIPLLFIGIVLSACAGMPVSTSTLEPLASTPLTTTSTKPTTTACSSPLNWSVELNRSGGFAGLNESLSLDSAGSLEVQNERPPIDAQKTISQDQVDAITELLVQACPFKVEPAKKECADCFVYNLTVQMDEQRYSEQFSDVTFAEEMQPLVEALNQLAQNVEQ